MDRTHKSRSQVTSGAMAEGWVWAGTVAELLATSEDQMAAHLRDFLPISFGMPSSESQATAWADELRIMLLGERMLPILQEVLETRGLQEAPWACFVARRGARKEDVEFWVQRRGLKLGISTTGRSTASIWRMARLRADGAAQGTIAVRYARPTLRFRSSSQHASRRTRPTNEPHRACRPVPSWGSTGRRARRPRRSEGLAVARPRERIGGSWPDTHS
jgi:hypothetical protein